MAHAELSPSRSSSDSHYHETDALAVSFDDSEKQTAPLRQPFGRKFAFIIRPFNRWTRRFTSPWNSSIDHSDATAAKPNTGRAATAYLDGLRGVAALCVVFTHVEEWTQNDYDGNITKIRKPYGWNGNYLLACWPLMRLIFCGGGFAVALFFVMSGYVLSNKPYKLIMTRETKSLANCISSAVFRRWFRLFLPIFAVNFLWMSSWYLGIYRSSRPESDHQPIHDTWFGELIRLRNVMIELSSFFGPLDRDRLRIYNPPTWTIPDEFKGSMVVYVTIAALAQFTSRFRLLCEVVFCAYLWYLGQTPLVLFLAGMILCHMDALNRTTRFLDLPRLGSTRWLWILWYLPLVFGIYLGGTPEDTAGDFETLRQIHAVAAVLLMISIPRISWCKSLLETRFCQFLGRISYALYLTHLPVLWIIGARIYAAFGRFRGKPEFYGAWSNLIPLPSYGPVGMELNVVVPTMIFVLLAFGVGELATRFIDDPSVRFAQWLYRKGTTTWKEETAILPEQVTLTS